MHELAGRRLDPLQGQKGHQLGRRLPRPLRDPLAGDHQARHGHQRHVRARGLHGDLRRGRAGDRGDVDIAVEAGLRELIAHTAAQSPGITVEVRRMLLAKSMQPLPGNKPLVDAIQQHGKAVFGEDIPALGTPLYTDVRLFCEAGIPGVIYGAGPRTVLESHAKRADERLDLEDLRRATKVIARSLCDLLA